MKKQRRVSKARRIKSKTNYTKRLILLKSESLRFVVRKTNRYIILQIVKSEAAQDKILFSVNTKELLKYGWPTEKIGSLKSLGAAYLAGFLIGKKSVNDIKEKVILDTGLIPNTKGSKIYSAVKGISDAGIDISYNEKVIPENERIEKLEFFNKVKEAVDK
jgi:large subunit ribosomal protein L18